MHVMLIERYLVPKLAQAPSYKTLIMKEKKGRGKVSCSGGEAGKAGVLKQVQRKAMFFSVIVALCFVF